LPGLLQSLDRYPFGCAEQITSRALPLLYLNQIALAAGLSGEREAGPRIKEAIADLIGKQGSDGGFGLWGPGGDDLWLDAYVTDFLTRARESGHAVPEVAFQLALDKLRNRLAYAGDLGGSAGGASAYGEDGDDRGEAGGEDLAYALYVLARNARAVIGDLRYYAEAKLDAFATPMARAQLGAALALYGDKPRADRAFTSALALLNEGEADLGWRLDFGSSLRDAAALLALAAESGTGAIDLNALAARIDKLGALDGRLSTQEQAWLLLAAQALMEGAAKPRLELNGQPTEGPLFQRFEAKALVAGPATLINRGKQPIEVLVTLSGIPRLAPPAGGQGYRIERAYYDPEGKRVQPDRLTQGQRLVVLVTVTADQAGAARLLVDDPLPAGFEIENPSLLRAGDLQGIPWLGLLETSAHQEFRAERFVAAVDRLASDPDRFQLAYRVRAVTPGRFLHPAATVEDMYRPRQHGWTGDGWVEIGQGR
nr:alpha-2-macroglobulin [Chromatiaceae bacterium]